MSAMLDNINASPVPRVKTYITSVLRGIQYLELQSGCHNYITSVLEVVIRATTSGDNSGEMQLDHVLD